MRLILPAMVMLMLAAPVAAQHLERLLPTTYNLEKVFNCNVTIGDHTGGEYLNIKENIRLFSHATSTQAGGVKLTNDWDWDDGDLRIFDLSGTTGTPDTNDYHIYSPNWYVRPDGRMVLTSAFLAGSSQSTVLNAVQTYTGGAAQAGTVTLQPNGKLNGSIALMVTEGGTLGGSGTYRGVYVHRTHTQGAYTNNGSMVYLLDAPATDDNAPSLKIAWSNNFNSGGKVMIDVAPDTSNGLDANDFLIKYGGRSDFYWDFAGNIKTPGGLTLGNSIVGSSTFDWGGGAYSFITLLGATGTPDSSDYFAYWTTNNYWRGDGYINTTGTMKLGTGLAATSEYLIDLSAPTGMDNGNYYIYGSASNYWRGDGALRAANWIIASSYGSFGGYVYSGTYLETADNDSAASLNAGAAGGTVLASNDSIVYLRSNTGNSSMHCQNIYVAQAMDQAGTGPLATPYGVVDTRTAASYPLLVANDSNSGIYITGSGTNWGLVRDGSVQCALLAAGLQIAPVAYSQADEPDIPNNTMAVWTDTDGPTYHIVIDFGGTQKVWTSD